MNHSDHQASSDNIIQKLSSGHTLSKKRIIFASVILYLLFLSDFVCRIGVNTLYPLIQAELGLDDSQIGLLTSALMLSMSLFVLPFSYVADKFSKKKAITLMAAIWSIATILTGIAKTFPLVLLGRAGVGIGNSAYAPTSTSMLTSWFDKKKWGKVLGFYNTAMSLGVAAGALICGAVAQAYGWRITMFLLGGVSLVLCFMTLFIPEEIHAAKKEKRKKVTLKETFQVLSTNKTLLNICVGAGFMTLITSSMSVFTAIFYVRELGLDMLQVGFIAGLSGIAGTIATPFGGILLDFWYARDKRARVWQPAIAMLLSCLCFYIAFVMKFWPMMIAANFMTGFIATSFHTASQELVPFWNKAVSYGVYVTITKIFGVFGPVLAGVLSARFGLIETLSGLQFGGLIVAMFLLLAGRTYLKDYKKSRDLEAAAEQA